jgi:hypothetical protein
MKLSALALSLPIIFASVAPLAAQSSQAETAAACLAALESGNQAGAEKAAKEIMGWRFVIASKLLDPASECMAKALPEPWSYDYPTGRFRPESETAALKAQAAAKRAEQQKATAETDERKREMRLAAEAANAAIEAKRAANARKINIGVMTACRNLLISSPDEAFLNATCIESFLRNGLPEV